MEISLDKSRGLAVIERWTEKDGRREELRHGQARPMMRCR